MRMSTAIGSKQLQRQESAANIRILLMTAIGLTVVVGLTWWLLRGAPPANNSTLTAASRTVPSSPNTQPNFEATIVNSDSAPISSPEGMVYIPGGEFSMGSPDPTEMVCGGDQPMHDARPPHRVYVNAFFMDANEVTNEEFDRFVKATRYVTVAERKPMREEFPEAREENWWQAPSSFHRRLGPFRSMIITSGGATWRVPTGVIPLGQRAI